MKKQIAIKEDNLLQKKEAEIKDLTNRWKKALADYQNLEKHMQSQRLEWSQYATKQLVMKLLPVLENLEKVEKHFNDKGLSLVISEFKRVLTDEGVKEVEIISGVTDFDAQNMQCIQAKEGKSEKVLEVCQKGFYLKNILLRPAMVIVGK